MEKFSPEKIKLGKYIFFTGKGGVGKTSTACATAVNLCEKGSKVLLVSTDPASNLQDIFVEKLDNEITKIEEVEGLFVANLDPIKAADEYKKSIVSPYIGKLPDSVINKMEEELSGSCTVEIAAFNEFAKYITDKETEDKYDFIIFDTAPTGHTLRMLQLPQAWDNFIEDNTQGVSCLGQLSGLESQKGMYKKAVETLSDKYKTSLILVTRPEDGPLKEADRASKELKDIGIKNQILLVNGLLTIYDDKISKVYYEKQKESLEKMPKNLKKLQNYLIPLRGYNITGISNLRALFDEDTYTEKTFDKEIKIDKKLKDIIDDLYKNNKKVIFTMGKGGVGKTTVAAAIALGLSKKGKKVHLTTTDPADHLKYTIKENENLSVSHIDEKLELEKYRKEVLQKAKETMSNDDLSYIEEDLRSPCTQEIAVFRAFADIVEKSEEEIVVIDTAPTGHTLLLLESTQSYNQEIMRSNGDIPESTKKLLPRLKNEKETEVIIVTLAEPTPVYEALRLEEDLKRAGIFSKWWLINSSLYASNTTNKILKSKANEEVKWINYLNDHTKENLAIIGWNPKKLSGDVLEDLIK
ncbi:arsenical pump-driving ATPase [Anaerococcus vaginalis]|uniref:Arsenite-activated ATPase (ArsA) n=2 Tax=Anaerococcus vaginalis TaxID=33037 RepID=C7HWH9_9FIRM|nr:arsenical pump-driving ATPase [Anaerococcus vaginalis]EEU11936.1 arsenite-activated ATPase (arsA) [Anaerococcus vaginalis ATCC 51170]QQB61957.1 arsenical pump-driving ATPase [Anaerococcus vaginalis]